MKIVGYLSGDAISRDRERMEEHAARFGKPYPHELVIKADAEAAIQAEVAKEREAVIADYEAADKERLQEFEEWAAKAERWKAEGDMYGWNFFMGMKSGGNWIDIVFRRILRNVRARGAAHE